MLTKLSLKKLIDNPVANDRQPSHSVIASDSNYQNKVSVGKLWLKEGEFGKYLSGELNKENRTVKKTYKNEDGSETVKEFTDKAYVIITLDEYNKLTSPSVKVGGYEGPIANGEVPVADIPF